LTPKERLSTILTMQAIHMERSDRTRNLARFYRVDIQRTLFGEWAVVCRWGRIGTYGRTRQDWFPSLPEAETAQTHSAERKRRRGYSKNGQH
jgi:predicted DNA-binding WGR domain protein